MLTVLCHIPACNLCRLDAGTAAVPPISLPSTATVPTEKTVYVCDRCGRRY